MNNILCAASHVAFLLSIISLVTTLPSYSPASGNTTMHPRPFQYCSTFLRCHSIVKCQTHRCLHSSGEYLRWGELIAVRHRAAPFQKLYGFLPVFILRQTHL